MLDINGVELDLSLDDLFKDDEDLATGTLPVKTEEQKAEMTANVTKRINEVKTKTEAAVRESIAKELGFDSYELMQAAKDKRIITEAGYDPEDIEALIGPMLEKRLAADPRMQKLQHAEEQEKKNYISSQLLEIEKLTGLKLTEADLPKETIELWGKGVDLAPAYFATNSAKLIAANSKGSTAHLASSTGIGGTKLRGFSQSEKDLYKSINPSVTDEELNKKTLEVK